MAGFHLICLSSFVQLLVNFFFHQSTLLVLLLLMASAISYCKLVLYLYNINIDFTSQLKLLGVLVLSYTNTLYIHKKINKGVTRINQNACKLIRFIDINKCMKTIFDMCRRFVFYDLYYILMQSEFS